MTRSARPPARTTEAGSDARAAGPVAVGPNWLRLGIAAALGLVAGATLFATEAQGSRALRRPAARS